MIGMGETLLKGKLPVTYAIPYTAQLEQLKALLDHYHLSKVTLAGLSYGGGIGIAFTTTYPTRVQSLLVMAPFTEALKGMDQWIRQQVAYTRITFPLNPATDDELYDYFLRQFIYTYYPSLEPSVLENSYKLEAVYRMVQGIRHYPTLADSAHLPPHSVHLIVAKQDQYIEKEVHDRFWQAVPPAARMSRVDVNHSEHKIPESAPAFAAAWTLAILKGNPEIRGGREFIGSTKSLTATSGELILDLQNP
jgi:pimeloyl-ACP methyl ester carboxylesterase